VTDAEFAIDEKVAYRADKRVGWNPVRRSRTARSSSRSKKPAARAVTAKKPAAKKAPPKKATAKKATPKKAAATSSEVTVIPARRAP
jgi:hypothetical protein